MEEETDKQRLLKMCKKRQTRVPRCLPSWQSSPSLPGQMAPAGTVTRVREPQLITEAATRAGTSHGSRLLRRAGLPGPAFQRTDLEPVSTHGAL